VSAGRRLPPAAVGSFSRWRWRPPQLVGAQAACAPVRMYAARSLSDCLRTRTEQDAGARAAPAENNTRLLLLLFLLLFLLLLLWRPGGASGKQHALPVRRLKQNTTSASVYKTNKYATCAMVRQSTCKTAATRAAGCWRPAAPQMHPRRCRCGRYGRRSRRGTTSRAPAGVLYIVYWN